MLDLTTNYMGLTLRNPLLSGAGPLVDDLDVVKRLEDSGVGAIVMHSLFEEQIEREAVKTIESMEQYVESSAEAGSYFPRNEEFKLGPENYLEQIRKIKNVVDVPVIASLNGTTASGWLNYAEMMHDAGADALEMNMYYLPGDPNETGAQVERRVIEATRKICETVKIPVAVKLTPFYSSIANLAQSIQLAGAKGLVLFNRIYQPEIDAELLDVVPRIHLSNSSELPLRLRWMGMLYGRVKLSLSVSGGVHTGLDAVKCVMAGACTVQMTSALLQHGPTHVRTVLREMEDWMTEHSYKSVSEMRGNLSLNCCPDPAAYERANYARMLQSWRG